MSADGPQVTVVLCTYNRAERIERVVETVLDQEGCDFELIVVDDGSTDATPKLLALIEDERLRVVRRTNGGLSAARNTGLEHARGRWTVLLDDDDLPERGWLATLARSMGDPDVGVTCCGVTFVDPDGREITGRSPRPSGELFDNAVGLFLAGAFAARTDLLRRAGGYLEGLGVAHQSELFIRVIAVARTDGLRVANEDVRVLRIERRATTDRPLLNPRLLYDSTRWMLARHAETFAGKPAHVAWYQGIVGVAAARLGEWQAARRHLWRAAKAQPRTRTAWGRLALATMPPVGRRVWNRHGEFATHEADQTGIRRQSLNDHTTGDPELFYAWRYHENRSASAPEDAEQDRAVVRRLGSRLARRRGWSPVVDVSQVDGDLNDERAWDSLADHHPGLTICANLIERIDEPLALLHRVASLSAGRPVLVSTPNRAVVDPDRPLGPPRNLHHRREWTRDQFELLLLSTGFAIERSWFLPRRWHSLKRPVHRSLSQNELPPAGATMVFLVRARLR